MNDKFKFIIIIFLIVIIGALSVLALYTYQNEDIHLQKPKEFYFSSDYLSADSVPIYDVYGGGQQSFTFELRNFEDSLRFSGNDILYEVQTAGLNDVFIYNNTGAIEGGKPNRNKVTISIPEGYADGTQLTIVAESEPYSKRLCAKLILHETNIANYYIKDSVGKTYAELVICAEEEFTPIVGWVDGLSVDCTNPYVSDSSGAVNPSVELKSITLNKSVKKGESAALYFYKSDISADYSKSKTEIQTADTQIIVGG